MFFLAAPQQIKRADPKSTLSEQRSMYLGNIILKVSGSIPELEKQVRRIIGQINPDLPVTDIVPFAQQVESHLDQQRMIAHLMTIFGLLALTLATVGLYGVTSYGIEQRKSEIGVRMALGADRSQVVGMVMRTVALQCVAGLAIGIPLTLGAGRVLAHRLVSVQASNWTVFAVATLGLALAALIAGFLPARRAASIEPMQALRAE